MPEKEDTQERMTAEDVLKEFVNDIEVTGGLMKVKTRNGDDVWAPVGDPSWTDLAFTYTNACKVLRRKRVIQKG